MTTYKAGAVRYQVQDAARSGAFYANHLGFQIALQAGTTFAKVVSGPMTLYLSGPGSSGARAMPDGRQQEPGGWNRLVLEVEDLSTCIDELKRQGISFLNGVERGPGGQQIQLEDPDGNSIELFEPARISISATEGST